MARVKEEFNHIPNIQKEIKYLTNHHIEIGIFGEDDSKLLMIARVNEFGVTITPKEASALTIPLNDEAAKNSAGDYENLVLLDPDDDGDGILAFVDGKNIEPMYALVKKVKIPERAFMRGSFDKKKKKMSDQAEKLINGVLTLKYDAKTALNMIGQTIVTQVQLYMTQLRQPPNSQVTANNKNSSNPLIDDGHLRDSITYKIRSS